MSVWILRMIVCYYFIVCCLMLCYVMLSSSTRDEKHKNSEVLRLRGNGQGRTERKKFVTIEWNMFLRERTSYESYYYTSRCCRCRRRRRSLTTLTDHHTWVYVFCMRARSLTFICLLYDFFSSCAAAAMKAKYEFLPTTFERWFVVSMSPTQCNMYLCTIHACICEQSGRARKRVEKRTKNKIEPNRIVQT